ncbi:MAG: hypothetical protein QE271_07560 [Bacteriovoracaceae bacterium]|nr:hypothetical protein [Bacteriovoracaceae bacterium]
MKFKIMIAALFTGICFSSAFAQNVIVSANLEVQSPEVKDMVATLTSNGWKILKYGSPNATSCAEDITFAYNENNDWLVGIGLDNKFEFDVNFKNFSITQGTSSLLVEATITKESNPLNPNINSISVTNNRTLQGFSATRTLVFSETVVKFLSSESGNCTYEIR